MNEADRVAIGRAVGTVTGAELARVHERLDTHKRVLSATITAVKALGFASLSRVSTDAYLRFVRTMDRLENTLDSSG